MLKSLLNLNEIPSQLDASDGLAAAVCHYLQKIMLKVVKIIVAGKVIYKKIQKKSNR